ncbi:MAG: helix-turn-helix transcriptional regulator [Intrasporangiaceae bacterium]|nr:helix-turn-helix transcriptional regulator [Intrasporangiaceae bacterium]
MAANSVSARDISLLREVLDLARPDRTAPAEKGMLRALELMRGIVGCESAEFMHHNAGDFTVSYRQYVDDNEVTVVPPEELAADMDEPGVHLLHEGWWTGRCSLIERTGRRVVTTSRAGRSEREWAQNPLHLEYLTFADEIIMGFPLSTFRTLRILLPRETGSPFGQREITLMEMLLPHLQPLMTAAYQEGVQTDVMPTPTTLTRRQQEILGLVRLGMPNRRIGRIFGISEGTVRKHLENTFERLGVQSRTAAVAVAFGEQAFAEPAATG